MSQASPYPDSPGWPAYLPRQLVKPETTLTANLEVAALRYPHRTAVGFLGRDITYAELARTAWSFAGWLSSVAAVTPGTRVLVYLQNSPHWLMAFYGILRADAVVVPANPMYKADELRVLVEDSGAEVLLCGAELADTALEASRGTAVRHVVVATYADYLPPEPMFDVPEWVTRPARPAPGGCVAWREVLDAGRVPGVSVAAPDDLALITYTSGSTGVPKGCMHTHRTFMHTVVGLCTWHAHAPGTVFLGVVPMYQVGGLMVGVNCAVFVGGTLVPVPRWDRRLATALIKHYRVAYAGVAPTALIDLLSDPQLDTADLASLGRVSFGGATMPTPLWEEVRDRMGLEYVETYGMTETAATTHINPLQRMKRQCLGIPFFDTEAIVVDPDTLQPCAVGEPGEILVRGPQMFKGYWRKPEATAEGFVEVDGRTWFRSGDIGLRDDENYYFMTDRRKRMINASGFKVWPAEVEMVIFGHPAVREVCVIGTRDGYRGESVKAVVVLKPGMEREVDEASLIAWCRERMAAFKYPRKVEFVDALPKSSVGKILWRELQDADAAKSAAGAAK